MPCDPKQHRRRSVRPRGYDYRKPGRCYVTICTRDRACLFGHVVNGRMRRSALGEIARRCRAEIPDHFPHSSLDASVAMPNHLYGVVVIVEDIHRAAKFRGPTAANERAFGRPVRGSLFTIIRIYKAAVTRVARRRGYRDLGWQDGFYEHVVRGPADMRRIRAYVVAHPARGAGDRNNR